MALSVAAEALARSQALNDGVALALLRAPVVVGMHGETAVFAEPVHPIALVGTSNHCSTRPIALTAGDKVWRADRSRAFSLEGNHRVDKRDVITMIGAGQRVVSSQTRAVGVVRGLSLLFEGEIVGDDV
jgi:hypothetical protein